MCAARAARQTRLGLSSARPDPKQEMKPIWGRSSFGLSWRYYGRQRVVGGFGIDLEFLQQGFSFAPNASTIEDEKDYRYYTRKLNTLVLPIVWQPHVYMFRRRVRIYGEAAATFSYNFSSTYENEVAKDAGEADWKGNYRYKTPRDNRWGYGLAGGGGIAVLFRQFDWRDPLRRQYAGRTRESLLGLAAAFAPRQSEHQRRGELPLQQGGLRCVERAQAPPREERRDIQLQTELIPFMENTRQQKIAKQIRRDIAEILQKEGADIVRGMLVTVTEVRVSPDFNYAKVYLSVFPFDRNAEAMQALERNNWFVRRALGQRIRNQLKTVPELQFFLDDSLEYIEHIEQALKEGDR